MYLLLTVLFGDNKSTRYTATFQLSRTPDSVITHLRQVLELIAGSGGKVDEDQADELRDLCNDQLDVCGYDENSNLACH